MEVLGSRFPRLEVSEVGGWRLESIGVGWRYERSRFEGSRVEGSRFEVRGSRVDWRFEVRGWRVESRGWSRESVERDWRFERGSRLEVRGWRLEVRESVGAFESVGASERRERWRLEIESRDSSRESRVESRESRVEFPVSSVLSFEFQFLVLSF